MINKILERRLRLLSTSCQILGLRTSSAFNREAIATTQTVVLLVLQSKIRASGVVICRVDRSGIQANEERQIS
jgi:hypothetical protein